MDVLVGQVGSSLGAVAKATIFLQDLRHLQETQLKKYDISASKSGMASPISGLADKVGTLKSMTTAGSLTGKLASKLGNLGGNGAQPPDDTYNRAIEVQFNPDSIHLRSNAGDDDVQINNYSQDSSQKGIGHGSMDIHVEMSVKLVFDQIQNITSFQQDMLDLSASQKVSQGVSALNGVLGKSQSVQVIVEAFVAALRNPYTRMICFSWGDLQYEGMLRQVNTTYTMFNMAGAPVRATVELILYLVEANNGATKDYTNGYWYDAYYNAFIDNNPLAQMMLDEDAVDTV